MLTTIFRVILTIVHHAYAIFEKVESHLKFLRLYASNVYRRLRLGARIATEHDQECQFRLDTLALKRNIETINKLPVHLCIVVAAHKEPVSIFHLARILGWCVNVAIPYVSFYDHDGFLKRNRQALRAELEKADPGVAALVDWEPRSTTTKSGENGRNGFKRSTRVQVFCNRDGKGEIVTLVRNLSLAVSHGLLKMEEIDAELLNDKLRLENTPDPDLALVCAPALSTYGLLPWHTRTTEFYNARNHRDVTISDFIQLLQKYGRCQQRYGK